MYNELLTYNEVSHRLGLKLGTLYSMVSKNEIPHVRLGKRLVRFSGPQLDEWIKARSVGPDVDAPPGIDGLVQ